MSHIEVLQRIGEIVPTLDGWCTPERACEYAELILGLRLELTACIGVWGGRDVIPMALAHREVGFGCVIAVDPWSADASSVGQTGANLEYWSNQDMHDLVHDRFLETLEATKLRQHVELHRKRGSEVEPPEGIGLLVIDGNHGPDAVADARLWAPRVKLGGFVFCDDISWTGGSVAEAVEVLLETGFERLYDRDTGALFQRLRTHPSTGPGRAR